MFCVETRHIITNRTEARASRAVASSSLLFFRGNQSLQRPLGRQRRLELALAFLLRLRSHVRRQDLLAQADARWRHLDQLVVVDEFDGLLEAEPARRDQANRLVGA